MNPVNPPPAFPAPCSRREMLRRCGAGFGLVGLAALLGDQLRAGGAPAPGDPLAPRAPHFRPRARRVIQILANGGPSQMDTFDPKPALTRYHGKRLPIHLETERPTATALGSPFTFQRYGQSGLEVSELFAGLAEKHADDLCVIRSLHTDTPVHENCLRLMNCGASIMARPSIGAWVTYGLGTENRDLPGFVVLVPKGLPVAGADNWQAAFLPGSYQGTYLETQDRDPASLIDHLRTTESGSAAQRAQLDLAAALNRRHLAGREDPGLEARIHSFETAFRMQTAATDAFDISKESEKTREMYGKTDLGAKLLCARRLVERGVRFVQVDAGGWDHHTNLFTSIAQRAENIDGPAAALIADLKQRGLLDQTLIIWGGEFGRTPTTAGRVNQASGRDHHSKAFCCWMAGGGVKGGMHYGETDEIGSQVAADGVDVHDLHATILRLLGFDHTKLTYRYNGRDFRLTDNFGKAVEKIIA